jgi:hypothetical protein
VQPEEKAICLKLPHYGIDFFPYFVTGENDFSA